MEQDRNDGDAKFPNDSALMEQAAHTRHTVGIADQSNDLEQQLPPETLCKSLRQLLQSPGLIANRLPGETQHLALEGVEFVGSQVS
jgi:hypothetical protein